MDIVPISEEWAEEVVDCLMIKNMTFDCNIVILEV